MNKIFRYPGHVKPEKERKTQTDLYARELRVTLVHGGDDEQEAFIRGIYWQGRAKGEVRNDKVSKDHIRYLLNKLDPREEQKS